MGFKFTDLRKKGFWLPRVDAFCHSITKKETAELMASGYVAVVAADRNTGKATQIPKEIVDKLRPFSKQIL